MAFPSFGVTVPSLATWQLSYNGLVFGVPSPFGVTQVDGLSTPTVQTSDMQRSRDHGELTGLDLLGGRDITVTGDFVDDGSLSIAQTSQELASATSNYTQGGVAETPLWFQWPSLPLLCSMARIRKQSISTDLSYSMGLASYSLQFHATDPRLYGAPVQDSVTGVGGPGGGSTVSITYPGNFDVRPIIKLSGPINTPTVSDGQWGIVINLNLTSGQSVTIDLDMHSVLYNNGTSTVWARGVAGSTSVWPSYTNGIQGLKISATTVITCISADGSTPSTSGMQVNYAPAYMT